MYKIFFYGHFTTLISTKVLFESILNEGKSEIRQKNARQKVWMRKRKFHFYYVAKKIFNHKDWKASRISTLLPKISSSSEVRNILTIAKLKKFVKTQHFLFYIVNSVNFKKFVKSKQVISTRDSTKSLRPS